MVVLAQVGCGTQAQRQVNTGLVKRTDLQFVAFVDPNRDTQDYVDWETFGNRTRIRRFLEEPTWGEGDQGIRAGRDVARQIMETYYKKNNRPAAGMRCYEDYREMLERETDIQGIVNITPDHQHGSINISALRKGKAAISHKPVASSMKSAGRSRLRARVRPLHTCWRTATAPTATRWLRGSMPA
jgi:predicted dehydrogenase